MTNQEQSELRRQLPLVDCISLVIGTIIGTGIFLKTTKMSLAVGSPALVLAAWAVAGLLSLCGALVYAELGELFPHAGGEYVYARTAYGDWLAFLYGWQRFWIGSPGSIAAYGVGAATFVSGVLPLSPWARTFAPVLFIASFSTLNCLAVKVGGRAQSLLTALKLSLILGLSFALLGFSGTGNWHHLASDSAGWPGISAFGMAVLAALWAFDGWNNLPMAAGEVKDPSRNVPLALVTGVAACFAIYALANLAYFYALPFLEVLGANSSLHHDAPPVAALAAQTVFGSRAISLLALAMTISALGAMNGSILTGSRIPFAMARDGVFPERLGRVSPRTHVPVTAVVVQACWASVLALSGTFDQLTDWVVFCGWIFYALCGFSVLIFRKRLPKAKRRYKVPFYPVLPLLFCGMALLLLVNTVWTSPRESLFGLGFLLLGLPVFFWRKGRLSSAAA
jgi:basic amino acid/polyamine antiporter, APA family